MLTDGTGFKGKAEQYCHPRELATLLANYEHWSLGVELALAFNLAIVVSLVVFLLCTRNPGCGSSCILNCCTKGGAKQSEKKKKKEYHHLVSTSSLNKSSNLVVDLYTDEPDDDEPESQRRPIVDDQWDTNVGNTIAFLIVMNLKLFFFCVCVWLRVSKRYVCE